MEVELKQMQAKVLRELRIHEFSFQISTNFLKPITKDEARIPELVAELLSAEFLNGMIVPEDVHLTDDPLLNYSLRISILSGVIVLVINCRGFVLTYGKGETKQHLRNIVALFEKITAICIKSRNGQFQIASGVHGGGKEPLEGNQFGKAVGDPELAIGLRSYAVGGPGKHFEGSMRVAVESSLLHKDSLFFHMLATVGERPSITIVGNIAKRFEEMAAALGYSLVLNE
jgi:hypothetical protein